MMLISQISHTMMGVVDTVMVGRLGLSALAAVGLGTFLSYWPIVFVLGMMTGTNALVAQAAGAARSRQVGVVLWQGLYLSLVLGAALALLIPLAPRVGAWTGAAPETAAVATSYMQVRWLGGLGFALLALAENFYRGLGRTAILMWCSFAQLALNCVFNYALIFGELGAPRLGPAGAAWGTVVAQTLVGLFLLGTILGRRRYAEEFKVRETWRFDPTTFRALAALSLPIGVQYFMEMGGVAVFCAVVARLGDAQMAATSVVIQAGSIGFMVATSMGAGATTLAGQCVGAAQGSDARRAVRRVLHVGYAVLASTAVVYLAWPDQLAALFVRGTEAGELVRYARPLFVIVVVIQFLELRFNVFSGGLRGAGDTRYAMYVNVGSSCLLLAPASILVAPHFGVLGAWCCLIAHMGIMAQLLRRRFRRAAWGTPEVVSESAREVAPRVEPVIEPLEVAPAVPGQ